MRDRGQQMQLSSSIRKEPTPTPQVPQFTLRPKHPLSLISQWWGTEDDKWPESTKKSVKSKSRPPSETRTLATRGLGVLEELTVSPLCPGCPGSPSFPGGPCWAKNRSLILVSFQPAEKRFPGFFLEPVLRRYSQADPLVQGIPLAPEALEAPAMTNSHY